MRNTWTVIRFTFINKARTKSFLVTTLILALLITVGINIPYLIQLFSGGKASGPEQIGLVYGKHQVIAEELSGALAGMTKDYEFVEYATFDEAALNKDVSEGVIEGYLRFENREGSKFPTVMYSSEDDLLDPKLHSILQAALQGPKTKSVIDQFELTDAQIQEINTPVQIQTSRVASQEAGAQGPAGDSSKDNPVNFIVVYGLVILLFVALMGSGNMIASEVTTEKSSRIMEILITSVSPLSQMFGKVIGMFLLGMAQIVVFGLVVGGNLMLPHNIEALASLDLDFSKVDPMLLVFGILFYMLGYFLYAMLYAAVGSIVSRTEDLGQAIMPMTMISMGAYFIAMFSMGVPDSMLMKVSSYIPFFSPTTMIVRIGLGNPPMWEIFVSLAILVLAILFFGWLSAKIYRTGVLMYGKRPTLKEIGKAMKAYKI